MTKKLWEAVKRPMLDVYDVSDGETHLRIASTREEAEKVVARLNRLQRVYFAATRLRGSIGYAYISERHVFEFIREFDRIGES